MDIWVRNLDSIAALEHLRGVEEQNDCGGHELPETWLHNKDMATTCLAPHVPLELPICRHLVRPTNSDHQWHFLMIFYMDDNQTAIYDMPTLYLVQWLYLQFESSGVVVKKRTCAIFLPYNLNSKEAEKHKGCASWQKAAMVALLELCELCGAMNQGKQKCRARHRRWPRLCGTRCTVVCSLYLWHQIIFPTETYAHTTGGVGY